MNNECHGDYFSVNGITYYRCFLDGKILTLPYVKANDTCLNCKRTIAATEVKIVPMRLVQQVQLEGIGWVDVPGIEQKKEEFLREAESISPEIGKALRRANAGVPVPRVDAVSKTWVGEKK